MGVVDGKSVLTFNGKTYYKIRTYNWGSQVQEIVERASSAGGAVTHRAIVDAPDDQFTIDVIVEAKDVETINELKAGKTGPFMFHPDGNQVDEVEFVAEEAQVTQSRMSGGTSQFRQFSITLGINGDLTVQKATGTGE